jgi:hypothetical protein
MKIFQTALIAALGLLALTMACFGTDFRFKPLGGRNTGNSMQPLIGRTFFAIAGTAVLWLAYEFWRQ